MIHTWGRYAPDFISVLYIMHVASVLQDTTLILYQNAIFGDEMYCSFQGLTIVGEVLLKS